MIGSSADDDDEAAHNSWDFADLRAIFINCTLKRSRELSNTQGLADRSIDILRHQGVAVDVVRAADHDIATGVWPDMTEYGFDVDEWPAIFDMVMTADILVLCTPIWFGEKSRSAPRSSSASTVDRTYSTTQVNTPTTVG
jgi:NADPH-dependent FMN reductase